MYFCTAFLKQMEYKRILLKLSGESLAGRGGRGLDYQAVRHYALEIKSAADANVQVGVVIGGGNIFRGAQEAGKGFGRRQGDQMGMLATVINAMALQSVLEELHVKAKVLSAVAVEGICEKTSWRKAVQELEDGHVVIMAGGTGNPFFTTDTGAALRAVEIKADLLLKGTRVDGIYDDDPEKNPAAKRYGTLTYDEAYAKNLRIMDLTAFTLCKENNMPVYVYNANVPGSLLKVLHHEPIGTLLHQ